MIPSGTEIFVGVEPIDLRWGFERLSGIITERIARAPRSGALFVFFGKRRDAMKILFADRSGICLFYKRLNAGTFRPPTLHDAGASSVTIDERTLDDLLEGIDVEKQVPAKRTRRRLH